MQLQCPYQGQCLGSHFWAEGVKKLRNRSAAIGLLVEVNLPFHLFMVYR